MLKKSGVAIAALVAFVIASLAGHYLYGLATGQRFTEAQWAAAGAWFAGIATSGAVSIALIQTMLTRADARKQLMHAEERLARELDASRTAEMIKTIPPIFEAIGSLNDEFGPALDVIDRLANTQAPTTQEYLQARSDFEPWMLAVRKVELACAPALMLISEPNTQRAITDLHKAVNDPKFGMLTQLSRSKTSEYFDPGYAENAHRQFERRLRKLYSDRGDIVELVRKHLQNIEPLNSPWEDLTDLGFT